eukprot:19447-Heterococcus_DN1.PRE.3
MEAATGDDGSIAPEPDAHQQALQQSVQSPDRSYVFDDSHDLWPVPPLASASFPEVPPPSIEHASPASAVLAQHGVQQHTDTSPVQTLHNGGVQQVVVNGWWSQRPLQQQQQQHFAAASSSIAATPRQAGRVRVSPAAASKTAAVVANAASVVANDSAANRHTNRQQTQQQQQHHTAVQSAIIQPGAAAQTANAVNKSVDSDLQGATLIELCTRDKAKLAKLMQELSTSQSEVIAQGQRLDKLRAQNSEIISEMADTKSKFNQAIELLKRYQSRNSALQQECTTATQAKDAVQTKCDSVSSELQQLRDSSSESMTHLQQRMAVLHKELRASETSCKTAQEQHAKQLAEHKRKAEHSLSLCTTEKSTLQQQLADAKAKQLHTEELLAKSDKDNGAVHAELSELKAQLAAFKAADTQREHQSMQSIQMLQQTVTALQLEVTAIRTKQQLEVTHTGPHEGSSDLWLRASHNSIGNSSSINHHQQQQQQHYDDNALRSSVSSSIAQQRGSSIASERSHALQRATNDGRSYEHQQHQQQQQQQLNSVRSSYDYANSSLLDLVNEMEYSDDFSTSTTNDTTLMHNTSSSTSDQYANNNGYNSSMRQRAPISSAIQHQHQLLQQQRQYQRANVADDFDTKSVRSSYSINSHSNTTALHDVDNNVNSNSRSSNSNKAVSSSSNRGHTFFESMLS